MLIVVLVILLLVFGGGGFYGYRSGYYGGRGYGGSLLFIVLILLLLFWALDGARAEGYITLVNATTGPGTAVAVEPVYQVIAPYLLEAFGVIFTVLFGWLVSILQQHTNIKVTEQAKAAVQQAAMNAAGRVIAAVDDKLKPITIDTHSELIAAEVPKIMKIMPDELRKAGMSAADVDIRLEQLIAGKVGQLQAAATVVPLTKAA